MKKIIIISVVILICIIVGIGYYLYTKNLNNDFNKNNANGFNEEEIILEKDEKMSSDSVEEEIVLNRYKEMEQAMVDKDIDTLNEIVKDGTTFTHMSGKTQTKQEYFDDIKNGRLDYQSYKIENPEVTIDGNKAILTARVSLTANAYGAERNMAIQYQCLF